MPKVRLYFMKVVAWCCGLPADKLRLKPWRTHLVMHTPLLATIYRWVKTFFCAQFMPGLSRVFSTVLFSKITVVITWFSPSSTTPIITTSFLNTFIFIIRRSVV